jgi:hypothetical protein
MERFFLIQPGEVGWIKLSRPNGEKTYLRILPAVLEGLWLSGLSVPPDNPENSYSTESSLPAGRQVCLCGEKK